MSPNQKKRGILGGLTALAVIVAIGQALPGAEPVKFWPDVLAVERCPHGQLAFTPEGSWGMPVRLGGAVNTEAFERFPSLSRDGKFLFFIRSIGQQFVGDQAHFYWVDAGILDDFKTGAMK